MQTYWDLSEKERAALSREDVERFLDAELMTKGVLKVPPLVLEAAPEVAEPEKRTVYTTTFNGFAFETAAQVEAFYALRPLAVSNEYLNGNYRKSIQVVEDLPASGERSEMRAVSRSVFASCRSLLERRATVLDANDKRLEEHEKASREQQKVFGGVWEDWSNCRETDAKHRRVVATFNDYVKTAGDRDTAAKFLGKVFSTSAIEEAAEWCGVEIPDPRLADIVAAPMPAPPVEATEDTICF